MPKIRVLVVDDSFFMRKIITDFLRSDPAIEVIAQAADGAEALQRIAELHPQVVTLDIEMPGLNGLETLKVIVNSPHYPSVVIVSGYVQAGADITLECLAIGAADFVLKPSGSFSMDMDKVKDILIQKVKDAAKVDTAKVRAALPPAPQTWRYHKTGGVVIIGASTGGPAALETLLPTFPKNFPCPIVVAQHLPKEFTMSFVNRLDKHCPLRVVRASQNTLLTAGTIFVAPGGSITTISQVIGRSELRVQPNSHVLETPSINQLMTSAAAIYGDHTIGIILTGMGKDGAEGMTHIKQVGGHTIVQDESTSAVFGMGSEVVSRGLADVVAPLGGIMEKVNEVLV
jgi:two-component system chemotaxis response regulator CheB